MTAHATDRTDGTRAILSGTVPTEVNESSRAAAEVGDGRRLALIDARAPAGARYLSALIWVAFIVFPVANAIGKRGSLGQHAAVVAAAALFVAGYVTLVVTGMRGQHDRLAVPILALLLALAVGLTLWQASGWAFLFTYCAACTAFVASTRLGVYAVGACAALGGVTAAIAGAPGGTAVGWVASSIGIGLLMLVMRDLRIRNFELRAARAELARLAVAEERERFARDLHDLLGHTLSVITLKAELAGRMLPDRADAAAREIGDLEQVARNALGEVRDAVSGYRQPTLDDELAGARMALTAAGIDANIQRAQVTLDPAVEAVLAWAVREGATNVIRHSGARHCTLRILASLTDAGVEVIDDGRGADTSDGHGADAGDRHGADASDGRGVEAGGINGSTAAHNGAGIGHGLAGLAERACRLDGRVEAGPRADGGFRLAVTIPVARS